MRPPLTFALRSCTDIRRVLTNPRSASQYSTAPTVGTEDAAGTSAESKDAEAPAADPAPKSRFLLAFEYDGSAFAGLQWQPDCSKPTVQSALQDALAVICGTPTLIHCSSRTDVGVHALWNTAHVDIARVSKKGLPAPALSPDKLLHALNWHIFRLGFPSLRVRGVAPVPDSFSARRSAIERVYMYRIRCGARPSVFDEGRVHWTRQPLNVEKIQEACSVFVGTHNFSSFRAVGCQAQNPVRTIMDCRFLPDFSPSYSLFANHSSEFASEAFPHSYPFKGGSYLLVVRGRGFLYHQIRLMTAALIDVGLGKLSTEELTRIRDLAQENTLSARGISMVPPSGLFLREVRYSADQVPLSSWALL